MMIMQCAVMKTAPLLVSAMKYTPGMEQCFSVRCTVGPSLSLPLWPM